jgi:hypothetical protein
VLQAGARVLEGLPGDGVEGTDASLKVLEQMMVRGMDKLGAQEYAAARRLFTEAVRLG